MGHYGELKLAGFWWSKLAFLLKPFQFLLKPRAFLRTVNCRAWNPTSTLPLALPPQQTAEIEQVAPQLTVAVGAALAL